MKTASSPLSKKMLRTLFVMMLLTTIFLPIVVSYVASKHYFHRQFVVSHESALMGTAELLARSLPTAVTQAWCATFLKGLPFRVTIVAADQLIRLCDTAAPERVGRPTESWTTAPEILTTLTNGHASLYRESSVLGVPVVYAVARSIDKKYLVRVGLSLAAFEAELTYYDRTLAATLIATMLITMFLSGLIFQTITRALNALTKSLDEKQIEFLDLATHEIKTPLAALQSSVTTLRDIKDLSSEEKAYFLDIVFRNAKRLQHIAEDFLTVSSLELKHDRSLCSWINTQQLTDEWVASIESLRKKNQIQISTQFEVAHVWGHRSLLELVIANYGNNALKYAGFEGDIKISWVLQNTGTLLMVQDSGPGIPPHVAERIFDRFYRAPSAHPSCNNTISGTGLGLHIVAQIASWHRGKVWVESAPDERRGSRFFAWFPNSPSGTPP